MNPILSITDKLLLLPTSFTRTDDKLALRFAVPKLRASYGVTTFHQMDTFEWVRFADPTGNLVGHDTTKNDSYPDYIPVWFKPVSIFGLFLLTVAVERLHMLTMPLFS